MSENSVSSHDAFRIHALTQLFLDFRLKFLYALSSYNNQETLDRFLNQEKFIMSSNLLLTEISLKRIPDIESPAVPVRKIKLLDQMRQALRSRHYSRRTEQTYCQWVKRFVHFHKLRHPTEMGEAEINAFLTHLAIRKKVSVSTQNQALSALLFLYRHVLCREIGDLGDVIRARKPQRLPVVMTREEVKAVLSCLEGDKWIMASLMYGSGLRLMECLRLRIQDIDFSRNEITVRDGKGAKDRVTMLPESLKKPLEKHLRSVKTIHDKNLREGWGRVQVPVLVAALPLRERSLCPFLENPPCLSL